jgi:hypothetical protein
MQQHDSADPVSCELGVSTSADMIPHSTADITWNRTSADSVPAMLTKTTNHQSSSTKASTIHTGTYRLY